MWFLQEDSNAAGIINFLKYINNPYLEFSILFSSSRNICQSNSYIGKTAFEDARCPVLGKTVKKSFIEHAQPV